MYSVYIGKYTTIAERTLITDHTHGIPIKEEMMLPPRHRPLHSKGKHRDRRFCVCWRRGCNIRRCNNWSS